MLMTAPLWLIMRKMRKFLLTALVMPLKGTASRLVQTVTIGSDNLKAVIKFCYSEI